MNAVASFFADWIASQVCRCLRAHQRLRRQVQGQRSADDQRSRKREQLQQRPQRQMALPVARTATALSAMRRQQHSQLWHSQQNERPRESVSEYDWAGRRDAEGCAEFGIMHRQGGGGAHRDRSRRAIGWAQGPPQDKWAASLEKCQQRGISQWDSVSLL